MLDVIPSACFPPLLFDCTSNLFNIFALRMCHGAHRPTPLTRAAVSRRLTLKVYSIPNWGVDVLPLSVPHAFFLTLIHVTTYGHTLLRFI